MIWTPKRDLIVPRHLRKRQGGWFTPAPFMTSVAFPSVSASNGGQNNATGTQSATVNLPAGIAAGDLLLLIGGFDNQALSFSASGYTWLGGSGSNPNIHVGYKIATGTEGATIGVSWTNARKNVWKSFRIAGAHQSSAPQYAEAVGNNSGPDSPNLSPSWGATKTLWFAITAWGSTPGLAAYPSNCPDNRSTQSVSSGFTKLELALASANVNAGSFNPGPFTLGGPFNWVAATLAVRPK